MLVRVQDLSSFAFVALAALAVVLALDPAGGYFGVPLATQYAALIGLASIGGWVAVAAKRNVREGVLLFLSFLVLLGGLAKAEWRVSGASDSVIRVAAIPYVVVCGYVAALRPTQVKTFLWIVSAGGAWVCLSLFSWRLFGLFDEFDQLYHEEVFLVAPLVVASASLRAPFRYLGVLIGCLGLVASNKFTAYIVLLLVSMILAAMFYLSGFWRRRAHALATVVLVLLVAISIGGAAYYLLHSPIAPSGSADVRSYTYGIRWREFMAEPVLGGARSAGTAIYVGFKKLLIPSHSDILDILAYCGLFGCILFMACIGGAALSALRARNFSLLAVLLSIIATATVNPFLYQPVFLAILFCAVYFSKGNVDGRHIGG